MPRVIPPRVPLATGPHMRDRPGRWQLAWRNQRRRLRRVCITALILGCAGGGLYGLQALGDGSSLRERLGDVTAAMGLKVHEVVIEGRQKTPEPVLRAALGIRTGAPILGFSLAEARARLETIQWVERATIERRLPGTVLVRLVERRPFAVWQHDGKFRLIDRDGQVVSDADVAAFAGQLPLVVGAGAPVAAAALLDLLAREPALQARVVAAVRVGERRWNLRLSNGADVLLPEAAEAQAIARLMEMQASVGLLDRPLALVDLRLPDRLMVRPAADPKATPGKRT